MALAITLVLTSLISYYYYLRVIWKMYFEVASDDAPDLDRSGPAFRFATVVAVVALLAAGLFPGHALRTVSAAGEALTPRSPVVAPAIGQTNAVPPPTAVVHSPADRS